LILYRLNLSYIVIENINLKSRQCILALKEAFLLNYCNLGRMNLLFRFLYNYVWLLYTSVRFVSILPKRSYVIRIKAKLVGISHLTCSLDISCVWDYFGLDIRSVGINQAISGKRALLFYRCLVRIYPWTT